MSEQKVGLLFDMVQCWGCRACVSACMEGHGFEGDPEQVTDLSATALTCMTEVDEYPLRNLCRHCLEPSCASVCPVGALHKTAEGPVAYDLSKCMGCRYCMVACPFNIPRYEWDSATPAVQKCDMCFDRIQQGQKPRCAAICPADATVFGTREELLTEARRRLEENPDDYYQHIYGENEVGGTSVLFLTPFPVEELGYRASLGAAPLPRLTWKVLEKVPTVAVGGCVALAAFAWIVRRRNDAFEREAAEAAGRAGRDAGGLE
jgi:formate dehydrogenase iron-sulfur subunit